MKKALRYNELDELAWEAEHGYDNYGDVDDEEELEWYEEHVLSCSQDSHENPQYEDFAEDDETGAGIFGNELNHEQNANASVSSCVSSGRVAGHGSPDDILSLIATLMEPTGDYHYHFEFFNMPSMPNDGVPKQK